jgi:hypothetical protein
VEDKVTLEMPWRNSSPSPRLHGLPSNSDNELEICAFGIRLLHTLQEPTSLAHVDKMADAKIHGRCSCGVQKSFFWTVVFHEHWTTRELLDYACK